MRLQASLICCCKDAESTALYHFTDIDKFHAKPGIRLVRTKTVHCFLPGYFRNRQGNIYIQYFLEHMRKKSFINIQDIV